MLVESRSLWVLYNETAVCSPGSDGGETRRERGHERGHTFPPHSAHHPCLHQHTTQPLWSLTQHYIIHRTLLCHEGHHLMVGLQFHWPFVCLWEISTNHLLLLHILPLSLITLQQRDTRDDIILWHPISGQHEGEMVCMVESHKRAFSPKVCEHLCEFFIAKPSVLPQGFFASVHSQQTLMFRTYEVCIIFVLKHLIF